MYVELNHPSNISSRDLCINRNNQVWDDTGHEYQESLTRTIQITETQYQSLMDGIAIAKVDPPFYSILGGLSGFWLISAKASSTQSGVKSIYLILSTTVVII
jgi:hypothetical protein